MARSRPCYGSCLQASRRAPSGGSRDEVGRGSGMEIVQRR